jgi:hypothetical protein
MDRSGVGRTRTYIAIQKAVFPMKHWTFEAILFLSHVILGNHKDIQFQKFLFKNGIESN